MCVCRYVCVYKNWETNCPYITSQVLTVQNLYSVLFYLHVCSLSGNVKIKLKPTKLLLQQKDLSSLFLIIKSKLCVDKESE